MSEGSADTLTAIERVCLVRIVLACAGHTSMKWSQTYPAVSSVTVNPLSVWATFAALSSWLSSAAALLASFCAAIEASRIAGDVWKPTSERGQSQNDEGTSGASHTSSNQDGWRCMACIAAASGCCCSWRAAWCRANGCECHPGENAAVGATLAAARATQATGVKNILMGFVCARVDDANSNSVNAGFECQLLLWGGGVMSRVERAKSLELNTHTARAGGGGCVARGVPRLGYAPSAAAEAKTVGDSTACPVWRQTKFGFAFPNLAPPAQHAPRCLEVITGDNYSVCTNTSEVSTVTLACE
jgi:hypothetical protein